MNNPQESIALAETPREYAGLLWILLASILGFSLFCGASAVALSDPTLLTPIAVEPAQVVEFAFSNPNSFALLTAEAFAKLIPTQTATATLTSSPTITPSATLTPTKTPKPIVPTRTRRPVIPNPPTATDKPNPTATEIVIPTIEFSPTSIPDTDTPVPPPTDPPPTNPPPTDVNTPIPTDTPTP